MFYLFRHTDCCWMTKLAVGGSGSWSVSTTVDLNPRPHNSLINSSPVSASAPIIRLIIGCSYNIPIHVDDPDGHEVRCRFGNDSSECGGVCQALPGANVVEKPCSMNYTANSTNWFAVALIIEDFTSSSSTTPLSKVPLQFLIHVRDGTGEACSNALTFSESTMKKEQACIPVPPSGTFNTSIEVIETRTSKLVEVNLVAPLGVLQSPVKQIGSNRGVTVEWTPTTAQYGQHVFCFLAVDNNGFTTEQRCVTLLAGASTPQLATNTLTPIGADTPINQRIFQAKFDQEVLL
ncbi:uncharacterized protein LOC134197375 [Corticium candelabrum]|uniref:uncharacterized protein LOC134197375 n=1 Tax=Corticium candelabrum TaxID=121492 RepID=UPI002E2719AD|nr:uncharacterized protein LOC134197375 [Corticium candelabrum]